MWQASGTKHPLADEFRVMWQHDDGSPICTRQGRYYAPSWSWASVVDMTSHPLLPNIRARAGQKAARGLEMLEGLPELFTAARRRSPGNITSLLGRVRVDCDTNPVTAFGPPMSPNRPALLYLNHCLTVLAVWVPKARKYADVFLSTDRGSLVYAEGKKPLQGPMATLLVADFEPDVCKDDEPTPRRRQRAYALCEQPPSRSRRWRAAKLQI